MSSITQLSATNELLYFDDFILDPANRLLRHSSGVACHLRPKEQQLLLFFIKNRNTIISKYFLLETVWNYNLYSSSNTLEVHLSSLRKKLENYSAKQLIETVHGAGYRLNN